MAQVVGIALYENDTKARLYNVQLTGCICCFVQNVALIKLRTCKHTGFLEFYFNYKIQISDSFVCHHCHNMLMKIDRFEKQIQHTQLILNDKNVQHKIHGCDNLQYSQIELFSILPEISDGREVQVMKLEQESGKELYKPCLDIKEECETTQSSAVTKNLEEMILKKKVRQIKKVKKEANSENCLAGKLEITVLNREAMEKEREHLRNEDKYAKRPFKCEKCVVGFDHEINLKLHREKKHDQSVGDYKCQVCECVYNSDVALKAHYKRHFTRFKCKTCNKQYLDERSAILHYREKHGQVSQSYICKLEECDFETRSHRAYTYHMSRHNQEPCKHCGKLYTRGTQLRLHINTVHNKASVFKCELCDKQYKQRSGLSVHMQSAHDAGRTAYCVHCRMHFRTVQILARHMRYHSAHVQKKYMCDECGSRFVSKSNLKYHIEWAHLKIANYRCQHCSKVLGTARSLRRHIEFVHGNKQLPRDKICDYCGKAFTTACYLQTHIRTHTGERPHRCKDCDATFAHPAALYNHRKLLHDARAGKRTGRNILQQNIIDCTEKML